MMDERSFLVSRAAYLILAALAGAITALSVMRWREMGWPERILTVTVSMAFALVFVPWAVGDLMGVNIAPLRAACAITYVGALTAHAVVPRLIRKVLAQTGLEEERK